MALINELVRLYSRGSTESWFASSALARDDSWLVHQAVMELEPVHSRSSLPFAELEIARSTASEPETFSEIAAPDLLSVAVGGSVTGVISTGDETDVVSVSLVAGQTYIISLQGSGSSALSDTVMAVTAPGGALVIEDDDGGTGLNSLVTFTASATGTYQIQVDGYDTAVGDYTVDVREVTSDSVAADFTTTSNVTIGQTSFGALEHDGDVDMFAVTLEAGTTYAFELAGGADYLSDYTNLPAGELDTIITIYDAAGNVVASNDDILLPDDVSSAVTFTSATAGTYYIEVAAYAGQTGGYTINATEQVLSPLDSIDWGSQLSSTDVTVYFAAPGEVFDGVTSLGWSAYEIEQAMEALQTWANVTGLTFTISNDPTTATFRLVTTESSDFLGYFYPPGTSNAGIGVFAVNGTGWDEAGGLEPGGYGWITLIHEFGHGLGLAHPHDNGGTSEVMLGVTSPFGSYGSFDLNQGIYTTMSYNDGWQLHPSGMPGGTAFGYQAGPGALDIAVVQQYYGTNATYNNGNNVYVLPAVNAAGTFWTTIWDTGGIDSIVHSGTLAATIDLTAATLDYSATGGGVVSYAEGIFGGFTIANGVVIENATGGSGNDILVGNAAGNVLNGGAGADTMRGGSGNDIYYRDNASDAVIELAGEGTDRVYSSLTYGLTGNVENLVLTGTGAINGYGNSLANSITGNSADNVLNGAAGADAMRGGGGNDRYYVDTASDAVIELAGDGTDLVYSTVTHGLTGNVEHLSLVGSANINGYGNSLNNTIYGNRGDNVLNGAVGADTMSGGLGNDRYYRDNAGDAVVEQGDQGTDTVYSWVSYGLGANLEHLSLIGTAAINGYGNDLNNTINGNSASNVLNGGVGTDTLGGGAGDDTYYRDNSGDAVVEAAGQGIDLVYSSVSYGLGANLEKLILSGTGAINGHGNGLDNSITGNSAANTLNGNDGNDVLRGAAGNDALNGGNGSDSLYGGSGNDRMSGGAAADTFVFDSALSASSNVDTIVDFSVADDAIVLDQTIFSALTTTGTLAASAFRAGTAAQDADDRIIYDSATGRIYYDADGSGAGAQVLFAQVTAGTALTNADFLLVD